MNRSQKIVVSIVGITIVLLALLGITYAYYLTRIEGNTNTNSVSITTANLKLKYDDGNGMIEAAKLMPGQVIQQKTFTVKNDGNSKIDNYIVYLENITNTFVNTADIVYKLECTSSVGTCNGVNETSFPTYNNSIVSNSIDIGVTHSYKLTLRYKETGVDQSIDMNKTISGKIQIYSLEDIVDISGTVSGAAEGDYIEIHSEPQKCQIDKNNNYKLVGINPGEHTLYIKNKNNDIKATKSIKIVKHEDDSDLSDNIIYIKKSDKTINIDLGISGENIGITMTGSSSFNPHSGNFKSLSYNIINNSQKSLNGTAFKDNVDVIKYQVETSTLYESYLQGLYYYDFSLGDYCLIADSVKFNNKNGIYELVNKRVLNCKTEATSVVGKMIFSFGDETLVAGDGIEYTGYYLIDSFDGTRFNLKQYLSRTINDGEKLLVKYEDDFGETYFYRGNVIDNYVNFAGMCWRAVRVQGNGDVKLILEDKNSLCDSDSYTGDFSIGKTNYGYKTVGSSTVLEFLNPAQDGALKVLENFQKNYLNEYLDYLNNNSWCYDLTAYDSPARTNKVEDFDSYYINNQKFYYETMLRNALIDEKSTFKCNGNVLDKFNDGTNMYVNFLSLDESIYAGLNLFYVSPYSYLVNEYSKNNSYIWFLNSPGAFNGNLSSVYGVQSSVAISSMGSVVSSVNVRPAIILKQGTQIKSGNGLKGNPYVIK